MNDFKCLLRLARAAASAWCAGLRLSSSSSSSRGRGLGRAATFLGAHCNCLLGRRSSLLQNKHKIGGRDQTQQLPGMRN